MANTIQQTNPLTRQLLMNAVNADIKKHQALDREQWRNINADIVGAEIIYSTPDSFYLVNAARGKRFVVNVGQWQMRLF